MTIAHSVSGLLPFSRDFWRDFIFVNLLLCCSMFRKGNNSFTFLFRNSAAVYSRISDVFDHKYELMHSPLTASSASSFRVSFVYSLRFNVLEIGPICTTICCRFNASLLAALRLRTMLKGLRGGEDLQRSKIERLVEGRCRVVHYRIIFMVMHVALECIVMESCELLDNIRISSLLCKCSSCFRMQPCSLVRHIIRPWTTA